MTLYETVLSNLKGVIGSNKDGIPISKLNNEYEYITGSTFPLKSLGYDSILSFLKSVPKLFRIQHCGGITRVFNIFSNEESESNLVLYQMIQNTSNKKSSGKLKSRGYTNFNRRMPQFLTGFESGYNYGNGFPSTSNKGFNFKNFENFQVHISQVPVNTNTNNLYSENFTPNEIVSRDLYAISDTDDNIINIPKSVSIEIQTDEIQYKRVPELHISLNSLEFVTIIVEIIVEFRPLNLDDVVNFKIATDLFYYFNLFTGISVDPALFKDIVHSVLTSVKKIEIYEDLINCDDTKKYVSLNLATVYYSLIHLPFLEFHTSNSFSIEIIDKNPDNIIGAKFIEDSTDHLRWGKSRQLSDSDKLIIENQQFLSWIPGSMCLVQLPYTLVKSLSVNSIERAVILTTELVNPTDIRGQKSTHKLAHRTSFFLVDHKITISGILSYTSNFQTVKRTTYRNNDSEFAYVCNVSIRARCMPSKIQYLRIRNLSDVSQVFHDSQGAFLPGQSVIVYQLQRSGLMINFQPVYDCFARVDKNQLEPQRELHCYENYVPVEVSSSKSSHLKPIRSSKEDEIETIVISDSDDDDDVQIIEPDSDMSLCSMVEPTTEPIVVNGTREDIDKVSVISFTDDEVADRHSAGSDSPSAAEGSCKVSPVILAHSNDSMSCKCVIPIGGPEIRAQFLNRVVRVMYLQSGTAVVGLLDSLALMQRELQMRSFGSRELTRLVDSVHIGDYYFWCPSKQVDSVRSYNNRNIGLVEVLQVVTEDMVLANLVHSGLIVTVKRIELYQIPGFNNADSNPVITLAKLIGPTVAAFDLHSIPPWFSMQMNTSLSNQLFTAFFVNETELVLEWFDRPGRFLNIDLLGCVERDLTSNHCNVRSKSFIQQLSESLIVCRLFVGNLLAYSDDSNEKEADDVSFSKTLIPVTSDDDPDTWFTSIDVVDENGEIVQKLSPHCFSDAKFCIDRVRLDSSDNSLRLFDYQQIDVPAPDQLEGLYKFDENQMTSTMRSSAQFLSRYMMICAVKIPDLNYLFNKLIF